MKVSFIRMIFCWHISGLVWTFLLSTFCFGWFFKSGGVFSFSSSIMCYFCGDCFFFICSFLFLSHFLFFCSFSLFLLKVVITQVDQSLCVFCVIFHMETKTIRNNCLSASLYLAFYHISLRFCNVSIKPSGSFLGIATPGNTVNWYWLLPDHLSHLLNKFFFLPFRAVVSSSLLHIRIPGSF